MSFRTVMSSASPGKGSRTMSPPPAIASLKDDDEHRSSSRSSSRNGRPGSRLPSQSQQHLNVPAKRSPLASGEKEVSPGGGRTEADGETDADAEAEVDADAEGDGDHEEYEIEDDDEPAPRHATKQRAARDADEELLEAVDAAEANSSSSHAGGRRYNDED